MSAIPVGYKHTEVGVIPKDWEVKRLGQIGSLSKGKGLLKEDIKTHGAVPAIPYTALYTDFSEVLDYRLIKWFVDDTTETVVLSEPCVLIASSSNMAENTGKASALIGSTPVAIGREVIVFKSTASSSYISYLLSTSFYRKKTLVLARGTTIKHLYPPTFVDYSINLPPIPEQRAIAAALSDVDALLAKLDQLIVKKRDLKQAAMQQLLTGQTRLQGFGPTRKFKHSDSGLIPDDWEVKQLKAVSSMHGRIGWQGLMQEEFTESPDDPYLITGMNFKDGRIRWEEVYHIPTDRYDEAPAIQLLEGDVLMTKDGTIGKLLYVDAIPYPRKASLNSHLLVFRPIGNRYVPKFLFYQLNSKAFARHIELNKSGSTFFGLTQQATGKYNTILPTIEEQTAIATVLSDMDAELAALEARRDKTRALKQGMMQELLTGRIRLV